MPPAAPVGTLVALALAEVPVPAPVVVQALAPEVVRALDQVAAPAGTLEAVPVADLAVVPVATPVAVRAALVAAQAHHQAGTTSDMAQRSPRCKKDGARLRRASVVQTTHLGRTDVAHAIELHDAEEVISALGTVMENWNLTNSRGQVADDTPVSRIHGAPGGRYNFQSWWSRRPLKNIGLAGAACGAVADLTQGFCDARPGILALHCGAVRINGHLVAFTGYYRTGKTTLVTRLAAEPELSLFCDDVLPVLPDGTAIALGIQPRLRLPLPDNVAPEFRSFVDHNLTIRDSRYGYVASPTLAPHGTRAPLSAIVVLSRCEGVPASLHHVDVAEAAGHLIRQNIADPGAAEIHYDQIAAMANRLLCLKLRYSDLEEAAAVLLEAFESDTIPAPEINIQPSLPPEPTKTACEIADLKILFRRSEQVAQRVIGTDTFLWQVEDRNFYSLNPIAAAIWTLLETPMTGLELVGILQKAFSETEGAKIESDTAELLGALLTRNLVSTCEKTIS